MFKNNLSYYNNESGFCPNWATYNLNLLHSIANIKSSLGLPDITKKCCPKVKLF